MKLISSFHDYYDCMSKHDQDRSVLFMRETKEEVLEKPHLEKTGWYRPKLGGRAHLVLGFCGRVYWAMAQYKRDITTDYYASTSEFHRWMWNKEEIEAHLEKDFKPDKWNKKRWSTWNTANEVITAAENFQYPIWCVRKPDDYYKTYLTINPNLKKLNAEQIISPFEAWRELSTWHGNIAEPRKPVPHIDDVTMAEAKGFNHWSFRKEPSKKKK